MLEKGFSKPTERIERLRKVIINAMPQVESERACLATQAYKETEGLPAIMRRAKVVEKIFTQLPVTIREDELVVGSITINPRSTEICPEFSYDWVEKEFDTMHSRMADPFEISDKVKKIFMKHLNIGMEKLQVLLLIHICLLPLKIVYPTVYSQ